MFWNMNIIGKRMFLRFSRVFMKSSVFWIVMTWSYKAARRFGGTYHLYLQGRRIRQVRNQQNQVVSWACFLLVSSFSYTSILKTEAVFFSEMLGCRQTAWHFNSKDPAPHFGICFLLSRFCASFPFLPLFVIISIIYRNESYYAIPTPSFDPNWSSNYCVVYIFSFITPCILVQSFPYLLSSIHSPQWN
jgi:hypothetical protein